MTLRFEAEVQTVPKGPFEKCLVTAEAGSGDFWSVFNVVSVERLPQPDDTIERAESLKHAAARLMYERWHGK